MGVQQLFFEQIKELVTVNGKSSSWEHLEKAISKGFFEDVFITSYFLYISLLGTKFHEKLVSSFFMLLVGIIIAREIGEEKRARQFIKGIETIVNLEKKKASIARAFRNIIEVETQIMEILAKKGSVFYKLFSCILLLIPVADQEFKEDILELAQLLEEKRLLKQVIECAKNTKKEDSFDFTEVGVIILLAKVKELQVLANFQQRNSPQTKKTLSQLIDFYGINFYYSRQLEEIVNRISKYWENLLDAFEDYPKSTIRTTYMAKLQVYLLDF